MVQREKLPSKTLPVVQRMLKEAGISQRKLQEHGIGSLAARKLIGQRDGEVTMALVEKALALINHEIAIRKRKR